MANHSAIAEAEFLAEQPYDAGDPVAVNNARKKAGRERRAELDFTKAIMELKPGRKWMFDLLTECNIFGSPVVAGDTHFTYHNLGQQNIGKKLLQDVTESAPDEYVLMMKESREGKN